MKTVILVLTLSLFLCGTAVAQGGLVSVKSSHDVAVTANRLEKALKDKGVTLFARIDHAEGARSIGQALKPTLLLIFGNPALGTPLIQRSRTMAIDLPLKALIWEDRSGQVWLSYNAPDYLARRHGVTEMQDVIQKMQQALSNFTTIATQP
jgi:uncharacterized protein (DUF302 family)